MLLVGFILFILGAIAFVGSIVMFVKKVIPYAMTFNIKGLVSIAIILCVGACMLLTGVDCIGKGLDEAKENFIETLDNIG